ncbi:winged helix-turn-helix domain-containing protein, partial [Neorhizobium sp. BETTINA12A]
MSVETRLDTGRGSRTLVSRLGETLRQAIAAGQFPPGSRLPSEAQLTEAHGVSRTVVREAIASL